MTEAARAALAASDQAALTESQWQHVNDVLAAFVPDFARAESTEGQRREMIDEVLEALLVVHGRAASLVQSWRQKHKYELERRQQQERCRGLMRTIVRAWWEEADGRKARSLRVAVPKGTLVEAGWHAGRLGSGDCLSTENVPWRPTPKDLKAALQAPEDEALLERLREQRRGCELRGEVCGAWLPVERSAVPAGSLARLLLTYVRLVEGGRLRQRRREFWPEHKVGRGKKAFTVPAGYPAQRDRSARVERTRRLEMLEGVHRFVPMQGGSARAKRRMDLSLIHISEPTRPY